MSKDLRVCSQTIEPEAALFGDLPKNYQTQVSQLLGDEQFQEVYNEAVREINTVMTRSLRIVGFEVDRSYQYNVGADIAERGTWFGLRNPYYIRDVGTHVLEGGTREGTGNIVGGKPWVPLDQTRMPVAIIGKDSSEWMSKPSVLRNLSNKWKQPVPIFNQTKDGRVLYISGYGPIPLGN